MSKSSKFDRRVSRRTMLKGAAGELAVGTGYAARRDEIGGLATALETFSPSA